ncbi:MAG: hypothetical protein LQ344_005114 [Seirophora lacunosa]|nr:MAG: hypothetical protein LQ344_005114 [Seirophora lacunosa]
MAVDEESPLLRDATRQRDNTHLEDDQARNDYSSITSKHGLDSQPNGDPSEDAGPDRRVYVVLGMLMLIWEIERHLWAQGGFGATLWQVVAGRVVAGFGGGGMVALVLVLIADLVPIRQAGTWRSYFNIFSAMGRCVGGPVGGFLADTIGWRWSFLGQCPLIMLVAALVAWKLPKSTNRPPPDPSKGSHAAKFSRIDIPGSVLIFCTIASLLLVLDLGGKKLSLDSPILIGLICATLAFAVFFVLVEGYWAKEPVFPLRLALDRDVATAYAGAALQLAAEFGVSSTVPLYFQITQDAKAASAGARLLPGLIAYAVGGVMAGTIISRSGRYKLLGLAGPLISCCGFLLLFLRWKGHTNLIESFFIVPGDFGSGITQTTAFIALSAGIQKADTAVAMSGYSVCQQLGLAIGMSTTAAILQSRVRAVLGSKLGEGSGIRQVSGRGGLFGGVHILISGLDG